MKFELSGGWRSVKQTPAMGAMAPSVAVRGDRGRSRSRDKRSHASLKRWLRVPESQPAELLAMARRFPRAERVIRQALELLL